MSDELEQRLPPPDNCVWDPEDLKENVKCVCTHFDYCEVKKFGRDCADYRSCQTWKFYDKWGREYLE